MSEITKEEYEALKAELDEAKDKAQKIEANRNEILSEFKDYKKTAAEKAEQERLELEQKAIDAAKEAGEFQKALELEKQQSERVIGELKSTISAKNESEIKSANKAAVSDVLSKFATNDLGMKRLASTIVEHSHDEQGNIVANYRNLSGEVIADSFDDWYKLAQKDPDMQNYLAGSKSAGVNPSDLKPSKTDAQKFSNDVQGFLNNALNQ